MKMIKNIFAAGIIVAAIATITSCQKKFDADSYRPPKPPPIFGGYSSSKQIAPDNLVAYWAFNGSLIDSVSKTSGTAVGTTFGTTGITNKSLQGALNSYALCDAPEGLKTLQAFTLSAWVNTPPPSNGIITYFSYANTKNFWGNLEVFFEKGSSTKNGMVRVHMAQNGNDNTYAVDSVANLFNTWVNIVVTYKIDGTCTLYVNGASVNSGKAGKLTGALAFTNPGKVTFGTTQFMTTPSQTTGSGKQDWASYLTGQIDQVRIYNKALGASQVSALYNLDKAGR